MSANPEIRWQVNDDLCDCAFPRTNWWTNPYVGKTYEIRMCCFIKKLTEMFPELGEFVQETEAFDNYNKRKEGEGPYYWESNPLPWSGDTDMPRSLWYRQLQSVTGKDLETIREEYDHRMPPKATCTA